MVEVNSEHQINTGNDASHPPRLFTCFDGQLSGQLLGIGLQQAEANLKLPTLLQLPKSKLSEARHRSQLLSLWHLHLSRPRTPQSPRSTWASEKLYFRLPSCSLQSIKPMHEFAASSSEESSLSVGMASSKPSFRWSWVVMASCQVLQTRHPKGERIYVTCPNASV